MHTYTPTHLHTCKPAKLLLLLLIMVSSNTIAGQTQLKQWCIPNQLYDFTTQQSQALPTGLVAPLDAYSGTATSPANHAYYTADPNKPEYETPTFAYSLLIYDPTPTAVEDISQDHGVKIYPNPTTNLVTVGVNLPETNSIKIEMLDMLGRMVNAMVPGKKGAGTYRFQMNTSHLGAGMYLIRISIGDKTITKKVQVQ